MQTQHYPFALLPLEYAYDSLEPYLDAQTVQIHHDKHLKAYVDNLNKVLANYPKYQYWPLEKLIVHNGWLPPNIRTAVFNNAGGVYNHQIYFDSMTPNAAELPEGPFKKAIDHTFGSVKSFEAKLKTAALSQFGSGWAWLVLDECRKLRIITTANQQTPLSMGMCPILPIDVWEHAYYLKYQNRRGDYADQWMYLINWNKAESRYAQCMSGCK